jgi:cytochrome o ubiquinol oxidase subunit 1
VIVGVGFQVLQLAYSIWKRDENRDTTGDPWNARTLEWSTTSPPPEYNFAVIPKVTERDEFWEQKQRSQSAQPLTYADITVPKNTPFGMYIAAAALAFGFAMVWHILWLGVVGAIAVVLMVIIRTTSENTTRVITAHDIKATEGAQ